MDSKTKNTLLKTLGKSLFHILFVISLIYLYYWFEKLLILSYNNESIRLLVLPLSVISIIYMVFYSCYFFEPLKNSKILIVSFKIFLLILFWITLLLLFPYLYLYLNILNSYFKFLLISLNIFLLVWLNLFSSKSYLINLIKYAINRKILYFLPVFLFILILNILMSIHTSFSISLEQSKYLFGVEIKDQWWQFFLLSLVNCLCSVIESTGDTNLTILIALTTIINSILFFVSSLIFTQSIIFTIKNKNSIFFLKIINTKKRKKPIHEVYFDNSLISPSLNIQKLKKEFWDKFENHYEEIKEIKEVDDNYFFVNNSQNTINDQLKYIEEKLKLDKLSYLDKLKQILYKLLFKLVFKLKLSYKLKYKLFNPIKLKLNKLNTQYKKYIDDSNKNINKIKLKKIRNSKINTKLKNINFFNDFQKIIKLEFPTGNEGKSMKDNLYDELAKKYSININEEDKENNYFFSLKTNFSCIPLIQNLDHNRLKRIYYFKFDKKYQIIESKFEEIKLKILYKYKKVLILQDMDGIEDRTNQIRQRLINTKKYDSKLIYQINLESEIEQIWTTKIKEEYLDTYNLPFSKRRKLKKIRNKELKNINNFEQLSESNSVNELISMHKVIITTTREGKINQSLKDRIYDCVTFDNIINFEETIYLSKKSFWSVPREKHSFQFLIKDFLVDNKKNWKEFNNLINQNKHYHNNKYKFLNKNNDDIQDIELEIIPIVDTLEHSDCSMECCSMECCSMNCCLIHDSSS